jgi:hypothetical protein
MDRLTRTFLVALSAASAFHLAACSNDSGVGGTGGGGGGTGLDAGDAGLGGDAVLDAGGGADQASDAGPPPTAADVQAIVTKYVCVGCHYGPPPDALPAGMNLGDIASRDQIVGVASLECPDKIRIVPGHPETSYLVDKLVGHSQQTGGCFMGVQMPYGGPSLTPGEIATIETWISAGALP